jgi:cyanophycinase
MSNRVTIAAFMVLSAAAGYGAHFLSLERSAVPGWLGTSKSAGSPQANAALKVESLPGPVMLTGGTFIDSMGEEFVKLAGGAQARLVIIPTAWDTTEQEGAQQFIDQWNTWRPAHVGVLHTRSRDEANQAQFVESLKTATGVWFTGGDQSMLVDVYEGTLVQTELKRLLARGGAIGGNCAGAMAIGELMIIRGKEPVKLRAGLGLVPGLVADSHWLERNRIERLREVIQENPGHFGVGIDRQTAVILHGGQLRVLGTSYAATLISDASVTDSDTPQVRFDVWAHGDEASLNSRLARFEDVGKALDTPEH